MTSLKNLKELRSTETRFPGQAPTTSNDQASEFTDTHAGS
jgi:hypothetical protein